MEGRGEGAAEFRGGKWTLPRGAGDALRGVDMGLKFEAQFRLLGNFTNFCQKCNLS